MTETRRLLVSFSGGETSALMAKLCLERLANEYDDIRVVFANTGEENEETLEFVDRCDKAFGLGVIWIEAVTTMEKGIGQRHRVVDFETASRKGQPFEDLIAKYGIPNPAQPLCSKGLKGEPIIHWARSNGWAKNSYDLAIGIRADEIDRMSPKARERRIVYPLIRRWPTGKPAVNEFWRGQPFRLELKGYEGNCKWCWKKSRRKLLAIMRDNPEAFDFPRRMERDHSFSGNGSTGEPRRFFRGNLTVDELERLAETTPPSTVVDDARAYQFDMWEFLTLNGPLDPELDLDACGAGEACEVDFGDGE